MEWNLSENLKHTTFQQKGKKKKYQEQELQEMLGSEQNWDSTGSIKKRK